MISEPDLKELERRTYLAYFNDGIADIAGGLSVFFFGLGMMFDASPFFIFSWLPIALFVPLKRVITLPRMGRVKFTPERQRKISKNLVLLFIAGTISLLLGIVVFLGMEGEVFNLRDFMLEYGLLVFGAVMATAFALVGILFEGRRFLAYAALVFGGWLSAFLLDVEPGLPVTLSGGAIALIGAVVLIRFLANNPLPSE